jgi:hypothetical protein
MDIAKNVSVGGGGDEDSKKICLQAYIIDGFTHIVVYPGQKNILFNITCLDVWYIPSFV